jgi:glutamate-5-semialdehyde dehydrogenase
LYSQWKLFPIDLQHLLPFKTPRLLSMPQTDPTDRLDASLDVYCSAMANRAKLAGRRLLDLTTRQKNEWLLLAAAKIVDGTAQILAANEKDLAKANERNLPPAQIDRLRLTETAIASIADGVNQIASLPDPVGEIMEGHRSDVGLEIVKTRVPIGTIFFIYESRPNVTVDAAALCLKSGNSVILRGGKEAKHSNAAFVEILQATSRTLGLPIDAMQLVDTEDRRAVDIFLSLDESIDLAIPRGGRTLIKRVQENAKMPVLKHLDGNCHVYIDQFADMEMANAIVINAKCHRLGVCNAAESLLIHAAVATKVLPPISKRLAKAGIKLRCCPTSLALVEEGTPATEEDWGTEYLDAILSVRIVETFDDAIHHINRYGSGHTDAIITNDLASSQQFSRQVDSAVVMVNASTRFNDGGVFGMGAEIGISTDKFHARGPCGLRELTTYKYVVTGNGQTRD